MPDRKTAPLLRKIPPFELAPPEKTRLPNGVSLFLFRNERLDLIHFSVRLRAGSLFENRKFLAHSTYNLLLESVPGLTSGDVEEKLDFYGALFQSSVSLEYVTLNFIIPKSALKEILPFLCGMVSSPVYKEENLALFKQRKIKEFELNSQKINWLAGQKLYHVFLTPGLAASRMLSREAIETLTVDGLQQYHQETFCAENLRLFISGHLDDGVLELVRHCFGQIPSGTASSLPEELLVNQHRGEILLEKKEGNLQSSLMLGRPAMAYGEEERRLFTIASTILGGYFGSRLMSNLREKNGYTYGVQALSSYFGNTSIFYIHTEANVDKTQDVLDECRYEMEQLLDNPVGGEELEGVKRYLEADLLRRLDGSVDYMRQYMLWNASGLDESEFEKVRQVIRDADAGQIQTMARKYFNPDDFTNIIIA